MFRVLRAQAGPPADPAIVTAIRPEVRKRLKTREARSRRATTLASHLPA
jgi:hypothetical protein